jgi:hypothetical protein
VGIEVCETETYRRWLQAVSDGDVDDFEGNDKSDSAAERGAMLVHGPHDEIDLGLARHGIERRMTKWLAKQGRQIWIAVPFPAPACRERLRQRTNAAFKGRASHWARLARSGPVQAKHPLLSGPCGKEARSARGPFSLASVRGGHWTGVFCLEGMTCSSKRGFRPSASGVR